MTAKAIEKLIAQRVAEALAAYEANRAAGLVVESQSQNGDDGDNGNGNKNGGGNGNGNPNGNDIGAMHVARECTYHDFVKCQPLNFKGTEGVIRLTRWFEKMETVFHINNCPEKYQVKYATCTLLNSSLTWWNSHKRTIGADAAFAMSWRELMKLMTEGNDLSAYTQRFQELTMLCTEMVLEEEDRVKKFIGGLPDNIQGNVIAAEPTRLQDAIRIANNLMDQKLKGYAAKVWRTKEGLIKNQKDNCVQQPPYKRQNVGGHNVARVYTAGNNERRGYAGPWPYHNKCKLHHEGPCIVKCGNCNKVGHTTRDCKKAVAATATQRLKNQNRGNKSGIGEARGKTYVLGGGEANPDSNIVMGMFLLNNRYASMLFDSVVDRSFVSTTFSAFLDVIPSTLDVSYAVELANGRVVETNTFRRHYRYGLVGESSCGVVCDEKIIRIPYGDEVLIVQAQVTKKETKDKSEEKRLEDVPTVRDFPKVFPEDLLGLPPTRQVELQIDLVPGAAPVARAP
ncbi:putative reverse transcriptase domain-containing protein [Tanacetum coccineum]